MTRSSRERFAEAVRTPDLALACALVAAEVTPDLDPSVALGDLDALAARVSGPDPVPALRQALAGFGGTPADYDDLRASLLPDVLRRRRGLPLLLSVVWVEVARRAGIDAQPVGLPGKVVVAVDGTYVDPFAGGVVLTMTELDAIVRQMTGASLRPEHLDPTPTDELVLRLLTNVRALVGRQPRSLTAARTGLWAVELSLLLPRHPLALRRERGELLVRLGDHVGGAVELEQWAEVVEGSDPVAAERARQQARSSRARLN